MWIDFYFLFISFNHKAGSKVKRNRNRLSKQWDFIYQDKFNQLNRKDMIKRCKKARIAEADLWKQGRIENYNKQMKKEQRRLTVQYNQAIIKLIKHKFKPLQRSKFSLHNSQKQHTLAESYKEAKSAHLHPQVSFPSLPSAPAHQLLTEHSESQHNILQKARSYIESKRRGKPSQIEDGQLRQYIDLFEKRIEMKERGKRESIELNLAEFNTRQKLEPLAAIRIDNEELELNQEERSIMNAKIRRKLNHRKIIDLAKRS